MSGIKGIAGSYVTHRTLADGTMRMQFDFDPKDALDAYKRFGVPGRRVAMAPLKDGAYLEERSESTEAVEEPEALAVIDKPKGGALAKLAGQWCNDSKFIAWAHCSSPSGAAKWVQLACGITSRAELDHSPAAAALFNEEVRTPYMEFLRTGVDNE